MDTLNLRNIEARRSELATCLQFRYTLAPSLPLGTVTEEIGVRILTHVVTEFREHNYEVSEPEPVKKSFVIGATCRIGDDSLSLSVAPPPDGSDKWMLLTFRYKHGEHLPEDGLAGWTEIRQLLSNSLANVEGVVILDWISHRQAIRGPR